MTDNEKYVKRGQALIIGDNPRRHREVAAANRNKVGAPFQYTESLFAALAVVKSMTGPVVQVPARAGRCKQSQELQVQSYSSSDYLNYYEGLFDHVLPEVCRYARWVGLACVHYSLGHAYTNHLRLCSHMVTNCSTIPPNTMETT